MPINWYTVLVMIICINHIGERVLSKNTVVADSIRWSKAVVHVFVFNAVPLVVFGLFLYHTDPDNNWFLWTVVSLLTHLITIASVSRYMSEYVTSKKEKNDKIVNFVADVANVCLMFLSYCFIITK